MTDYQISNMNAGTVWVKQGKNPRRLYEHQAEAINNMNMIDKKESFSTLVVLPTGGGKTMTAVTWLLTNAIDKNKKILWIAHRSLLLEQAADSFIHNSYTEFLNTTSSFNYRIVSGEHDRPINILSHDNVIIAGKDSLIRNLNELDRWLIGEKEIYFVIDEAHHATAKSYRHIIDYIKSKQLKVKILGLTATPFRTSEQEQKLLGMIFTDGMIYKIDLDTLIKKGILSTPIFESCDTDIILGDKLGPKAQKSIEQLDIIPEDIAQFIAKNGDRNNVIVNQYFKNENYKNYGQTLVFALNRLHALSLKSLFEQKGKKLGIKAGVIMTGTKAEFIGIDVSSEENNRQIEAYKNGEIQILINVNILTEGVDLPKTHTVFLTRPTISTVLMTQMIGRVLRGEKAGGTKDAYIVSFIDDWNSKVAWVNPESILCGEEVNFLEEKVYERKEQFIRIISIEKIEEFARIINDNVDTKKLEAIPFIQRVPIGMYVFSYIDDNKQEHNHQILVYSNTRQQYAELITALPALFEEYNIQEELLTLNQTDTLVQCAVENYFDENMLPPYNTNDIEALMQFYAQKESAPLFISIDEINRKKVDLTDIAKYIIEQDMRESEKSKYKNKLWDDETTLIKMYFNIKDFFTRQLQTEIDKLNGDFYIGKESEVEHPPLNIENMTLWEIRKVLPEYAHNLMDSVFNNAKTDTGNYICNICHKTSPYKALFHIDHIKPLSKGGKTLAENMQLLCHTCNIRKGDKF